MKRFAIVLMACAAAALAVDAQAAEQTYHYVITHSKYGKIGSYDRLVDQSGGTIHAQSKLHIAVKVLGIIMHRENADQNETWRNGRLVSFHATTTTNGSPITVSGEARGGGFVVTTPTGTVTAPADVAASDPMGFSRTGRAEVVSIRSGKVEPIDVVGGQPATLMLNGTAQATRHFQVNTATVPDKWEVWLNAQGVPVKFRSRERGDAVDFTLAAPPESGGPSPLAMAGKTDDAR
jgi:hypothetical protein